MSKARPNHFYPERMGWIGLAILGTGGLLALPWVLMLGQVDLPSLSLRETTENQMRDLPFNFSLPLDDQRLVLPIPNLQEEITFSFDPPRPTEESQNKTTEKCLLVRLKKSAESKRVSLPCRVDLEFREGVLVFAKSPSSFWIELTLNSLGQIEGSAFITSLEKEKMNAGHFIETGQECPIQEAQEFTEGSPFRLLAEAKWWGRDPFLEQGGQRLEVGSEMLELNEGWLIWKEGKWQKSAIPDKEFPIAHIRSLDKSLILEGWDSNGHIQIRLNLAMGPQFKLRGEDLFSPIRIRSEKQISCMLEKQCMVLKIGDWVFKTGGRWKTLRKKEERDAVLNGKLIGELFVFEQISQKQGQKMIHGRLFNAGRTHVIPIEMAAQSTRKVGEKNIRKGRAQ